MNETGGVTFRRAWVLLALAAVVTFGLASTATATFIFWRDFDNVTAPDLPFGMILGPHTGSATWATNEGNRTVAQSALSAPNLLYFNSAAAADGDWSRLHVNEVVDVTPYRNLRLVFNMYHDSGYPERNDHVLIEVSANGGEYTECGSVSRYRASDGWEEHTIDLGGYDGTLDFRFALRGISGHGNDLQIDNFRLEGDIPACTPPVGTIGTRIEIAGTGFGTKKGKLRFGDSAAPVKVLSWTDTLVTCQVTKGMAVGEQYDVGLQPGEPKGADEQVFAKGFTYAGPDMGIISPSSGAPKAVIQMSGDYFGTKKGKVYLRQGSGPDMVSFSCKVATWTMDADDNESLVEFAVPNKAPPGEYDLVLVNALGEDILTSAFEVLSP